jgi:hypothetical protein
MLCGPENVSCLYSTAYISSYETEILPCLSLESMFQLVLVVQSQNSMCPPQLPYQNVIPYPWLQ